jgi:hypothetical protein
MKIAYSSSRLYPLPPPVSHSTPHRSLLVVALLAACTRDDASRHVYSSPPPRPHAAPVPAPEPVSTGVARGPTARIDAVRIASTGVPAALEEITEPVELMVLVRRGEATPREGPLWIELRLTGESATALIDRLEPPVPAIVARPFRIAVSPDPDALPDGRYSAEVRLVTPAGRVLASSVPLLLVIRTRR